MEKLTNKLKHILVNLSDIDKDIESCAEATVLFKVGALESSVKDLIFELEHSKYNLTSTDQKELIDFLKIILIISNKLTEEMSIKNIYYSMAYKLGILHNCLGTLLCNLKIKNGKNPKEILLKRFKITQKELDEL